MVAVAGEVRFEPPLPRHLVYYPPGSEPAPTFSGLGVPVRGVDLSGLQDRLDKDGALEGFATLRGQWRAGVLEVTEQRPPQWPADTSPDWVEPPCPPPAGGWPHGGENENLDPPAALVNDPATVHLLLVRPSRTQVVLTVVSSDPQATLATWSPVFRDRLCVIEARWPRGDVESLTRQAQSRMAEFHAYQAGSATGVGYQPVVTLSVVLITPALLAWEAEVPDDLLQVSAWLHPQHQS